MSKFERILGNHRVTDWLNIDLLSGDMRMNLSVLRVTPLA